MIDGKPVFAHVKDGKMYAPHFANAKDAEKNAADYADWARQHYGLPAKPGPTIGQQAAAFGKQISQPEYQTALSIQ